MAIEQTHATVSKDGEFLKADNNVEHLSSHKFSNLVENTIESLQTCQNQSFERFTRVGVDRESPCFPCKQKICSRLSNNDEHVLT